MVGKKRKTKASGDGGEKGSKSNPPAASLERDDTEAPPVLQSSPLWTLIQELHKLAIDSELCHQTLQALSDGTSPVLSLLNKEGTTSSSGPSDITGSGSKKKKRSRGSATATPSNNQASSEALSSDDPASTSSNGYMILLATHILNRLLAYTGSLMVDDESNQKREKVAQVVSFITYLLSRILLPTPDSKSEDRALLKLLERACASNARSLLGRAILSISVASTWALEHLTSDQCGNNDNSSLEYWIPATLALDSVVRLSHHCPKSQQAVTVAPLTGASPSGNSTTGAYPVKFWDRSQALFEEKAMSIFTRESAKKHLESTCEEVSDLPLQYEEACLIALLANPSTATAIEEATTSPPAKRGSGSRQTRKKSGRGVAASTSEAEGNSQEVPSSSSSLGQSFSALINDAPNAKWNNIRIDGRVAVKRWSSMGLVWLFKGHMRVLEATLGMLKDRSQWQSVVWDIYGSSAEEPRKKNKTSADSAQSDDRIPGNAALVALISRLMGAISEMHAQSGSRAPAGGFEAYAKLIIPADSDSVETSVATKSPSKSKTTKTVPLDLRNIAIVVFYHLLQAHEDCLKTNFCNDDVQLLNNESKNPNMQYKFSPVLNRLIQGLSRVAAATSCTTLSFTDQTLEMQRLEKIAAAFILKIMKDGKTTATEEESSAAMEADPPRLQCPIDVQLVDFAILQLSDCLEKVDKSLSDTKDERKTSSNHAVGVIAHYRLEEPLSIPDLVKVSIAPVPSTGQRRRGSKASATMLHATTSSQACSYAGAFRGNDSDEQKSASEDNILSLFLRALVSPMKNDSPVAKSSKGKKKKKTKSQARENDGPTCQSKLYGTLIDILSLCYNGAGSMNELVQEKPETNSAVNRKREISSTKGPARKRRRTNEAGGSEETVSDCLNSTATMSEVSKEQTRFQNALNLQTANLAQNTTDVLRICISTSLDGATGSSTAQLSLAGALRQSIRDAIEGEHLSEVTELVRRLDSIVVLPRTIHGKALKEKERKQRSEDIDSPRFSSFAAFERDLWLSTLRLCIVIGRGYHVEKEDDDAISSNFGALRDRKRRLALFQSIAKAQVSVDRWPLWLPTGLRALVTSNISAKAMSLDNGQDVSPERFVVEGFFESIKQALGDLKSLAVKTENSDADISIIEYEIPLSLEDARLFMVAFGRLAPAERNKLLPKVLSEIQTSIAKIYEKEESLVCENKDISGFIARLVTLCSNLTIWTSYTDLWDRFNEFVASNQPFEMPSFVNRGDWYRSGRCYMGLFSDWESAVPPFLGDASAESVAVANAAVGKAVASILDISFRMGFVAAKNDKGHLLFSAWNAIGNMPIWDPRRNDKSRNNSLDQLLAQVQTAKEGSLDLPGIILQIRDEICKLHFDVESIGGTESSFPLTLKLAGAGERAASSPAQVKKSLKAALAVGESFMNNLLEHEDESLEIFSTLEALSVYITFAVASHTKSGDDIFSTAHVRSCILRQKRARGYSSESERDPSDLESCESDESGDEDAASKLQSRLHEACSDFGAAPTHPDWLDKSCNLQPGIAASEALDASRTAVRALSKLLASSFYRHKKSLQQALDGIIREQKKDKNDGKAALAMKLIALLTRYDSESRYLGSCFDEPDEDEVPEPFECLSSVFGTDEDILSQALRLCSDDPFVEVKEAWCPNAAQRILGRFYSSNSDISERWLSGDLDVHSSPAELRVDGQWEVLLGAALASSCRGISQFPKDLLPSEVSEALSNAESWRKLCETAINCLMPAAALLRFGLARTGRSPHPLALEEEQSEEVFENKFHHFEISERIPVSITASKQLRETVAEGLGLMARYCAQCAGDSPVSLTCHAVATNLMVDGKLFEELRGLEACRFAFTTLSELEAMSEGPNTRQASNTDVLPFVNQQLTGIIEFWGRRDVHSPEGIAKTLTADKATPTVGTDFSRLLALLGLCSSQIDTIAENNIITCGVLSLLDKKEEEAATYSSFEARWHWGNRNDFPVFTMVSLLCRDASHANLQTRACLGMILSQLASRDCASSTENTASDSFISTLLLKAFNSVAADQYEGLLSECVQMLDETCDGKFQRETCSLLALLLNARPGVPKFSKVDATVTFLLKSAPNWLNKKSKGREHVLDLLILYGCHKSSLPQIGSLLLSILTSSEHEDLEPMARYFRFLQGLRAPLSRKEKSKDDSRSSSKGTQAEEDASKRDPPPRSCSYAQRSGFHGQHWYNCYTCGLTWDKGCCTLCALVCHKGHDVSYSRYSSFFCDCGAESEEDRSRSSCKCLSTLARERVQELFEKEGWIVPSDPEPCHDLASGTEGNDSPKFYIDIANASFPKQVKFSVDNLVAETSKLGWLDLLFGVLRKSFNAWCGSGTSNKMLQDSPSTVDFEPDECDGYEYFRQSLQKRIGKVVEIEPLNSAPLVPIRAAKSNSFQVKFSGTSNERLKRSKNEIARASVVADNRGRLVIAEPCSLLFCSMGNAVNMKHVTNAVDIPLSRSSVCILGSATVRFNVVGMQLCPENDRHLLVWGASEACIAVLKDSHNDTERMIYLSLDLNPTECENDYIVKSCWIPGSQTCIAIGCGRFVSIFDIARADKDNRAVPVVSFGLGSDANLRDIEVTPAYALNQSTNFSCDSRPETAATLFILLENGRVYSVDLDYDTEGKPTARGDQQFEANESISFPLAGVRSYGGSAPGLPGSQQKTLGDGSFLTYLSQSHLLLYKSTSSCVLALTLGITGKINGSFELLPHTLSPEILGTASTGGYSIGGPYNYFTELGMSQYDDGSHYFRVACVGRSFRTNQPKLLCVEFNEIHVKVKEISWESDSIGLGLSLYSSFEGVCSFSLPCRCEDADVPDSNDGSRFAERGFLCAVTSNGCLLLYGEENGLNMSSTADISRRRTDAKISRNRNKSEKTMVPDRSVLASNPITLFERLKLVSDEMTDEVVFGGDGLGSDSKELKRKLSRDNSVFLMSPRREGFTLTVMLKAAQTNETGDPAIDDLVKKSGPKELAIAAVRVLVGSTSSDCIPQKIFVQGRPIELQAGTKKWYSVTLTDEEIAITVRTGVLSVGISHAFDSTSSPLLDAIEIYAINRQEVDPWLPRRLSTNPTAKLDLSDPCDDSQTSKALVLSSRSLEALCELVGPAKSLPKAQSDLLKRMVQEITVNRNILVSDCVENLLKRLYPNPQARNSIKDEGALQGCSMLLSHCQTLLESSKAADDADSTASADFDNAWFTVRAHLRSCLRTSAYIACCRPVNYLRASDVIAENKVSSGSIAVDSSKLISEGIQRSLPCEDLCELFVELSLAESAIAANTDIDQGERLASFIVVRKLLESENLTVVERACHAISSFCRKYGAIERSERTNDLFGALQAARIVCYQCDCCAKFPISGVRYTLLEDDHDIDLCKNCFRLGADFAESSTDMDGKVVINGKTIDNLTCGLIKIMQPVPIVKADVTEAEAMDVEPTHDDDAADEDGQDLQKALRLSVGAADDKSTISSKVDQSFEDFVDGIFSSVVGLLSDTLSGQRGGPRLGLMLGLLIDLVHHSSEEGGKFNRARKVATEISVVSSRLIHAAGKSSNDFQRSGRLALIMCLRALAYLLVEEHPKQEPTPSIKHDALDDVKSKAAADSKVIKCPAHGVPAVRRRCARGDQRDRRFYVCGMSRSQRCKFFVWADQVNQQAAAPKPKAPKTRFHKVIAGCLWGLFSKSTDSNKEPLHLQLCTFLEEILSGWKCGGSARLTLSADSEAAKGGFLKPSLYDEARALADFYDGVLCSREKLQDLSSDLSPEKLIVSTDETSKPSIAEIANTFYADGEIKLLEASLELLALIANHETDGIEHWFSLLCEIIGSPNKTANVRSLAKRVLKQLCGGKKDLYHSVRDHFVFGFQVKTLLHNTHNRLQTCLLLKEKARQSGPHWKTGSVVKWNTLQAGGLIGTEILVSEDCSSMQSDITTGEILDELWNVAKSRGENWRNFCSLTTLPNSHKGGSHEKEDAMFGILNTPAPVVALLWIACSLVGSNQIKAFKLIDLALSASKEKKKSPTKPNASSEEDDDDGDENTGGDARGTANDRSSWLKAEVLSPEGILLNGARKMTTDDFHAFMMQFAYRGRTAELRRVACSIASKLLRKVKPSDTGLLLGQLLGGPLCDAGQLGKNSVELLNVLQSQLRIAGQLPIQVTNAADSILFYFKKQYQAIKHDRANGEYVCIESSSGTLRKRLDLASCVHCHFNSTVSAAKEASKKTPSSRATPARASSSSQGNAAGISALNVASLPTQASRRVWLPEQVGPFSKLRLDNQKESTANDGFATFRQLKYRLVLSEVHVSINDPRGRFVKTITVYFTPRPVNDVQILKSDETKWQRCATISLTRGASRASATLPVPVVAANLKIEFTDFYERPGGSKAADGSMLLHCPRCTRVVNNAIGVCANCGEHAFQCRRCRHIDYNAIQSFLCVECGFCSAGSFNFDLVAAVASNAVAITSDKDYERANRILNTAKRLHEELREALREKLNLLLQSRKPKEQQEDTNLSSFLSSPGLRRAFQSESATLTIGSIGPDGSIEGIGRKGWAVKTIASPNPGGIRATPGPAATDRTRSLIRLAQQIRNDNGSPEQRRNGDLIIRQLGGRGGTSTEALDEESDLLNLLEGSGGGGLAGLTDAPDPLSRLLASFQTSRGRNCTTATNAAGASAIGRTSTGAAARGNGGSSGRQGQGVGSMSKKQVEAKFAKALEECELLHALLRETEREAYELASRIQAWKRLERDELAQTGRLAIGIETNEQRAPLTFSPSHCSVCSNAVAVQLLVLWLRLFQANPSGVAISEDFIELLLEENIHLSKSLVDLKRTVIREIATKSPAERSRFVLSKLSNRVRYARDISSAEILGKIIEVKDNFVLSEEYVELAMSVLQHESSL